MKGRSGKKAQTNQSDGPVLKVRYECRKRPQSSVLDRQMLEPPLAPLQNPIYHLTTQNRWGIFVGQIVNLDRRMKRHFRRCKLIIRRSTIEIFHIVIFGPSDDRTYSGTKEINRAIIQRFRINGVFFVGEKSSAIGNSWPFDHGIIWAIQSSYHLSDGPEFTM